MGNCGGKANGRFHTPSSREGSEITTANTRLQTCKTAHAAHLGERREGSPDVRAEIAIPVIWVGAGADQGIVAVAGTPSSWRRAASSGSVPCRLDCRARSARRGRHPNGPSLRS